MIASSPLLRSLSVVAAFFSIVCQETAAHLTMTSSYDALNRLSSISDGALTSNGNQWTTSYSYDLGGNIMGKSFPNGDQVLFWYDGLNRVYEEEGVSTNAVLYHYLSQCDAMGNLASSTEYTAQLGGRTVNLGYDGADRLISEGVADQYGAPVSSTSYDYDAANNRAHKTLNGVVTTYTCNNLNQITAWSDTASRQASYSYDNNGNRATRTVNGATDTYSYDVENRLVTLAKNTTDRPAAFSYTPTSGTYNYVYDYRSRRVARSESGTATQIVFSGGTSVQEYASSGSGPVGSPIAEYVRGSDWGGGVGGILYSVRGGAPSFAHYDRRGDVTTHTNSSGTVTWQASYESGGARTGEAGTTADRQKANTKEEDPSGLKNEGMRYYDLETDSFITKDPAGFIDGPNLYCYVRQNPWTKFDSEGLQAEGAEEGREGEEGEESRSERMRREAETYRQSVSRGDAEEIKQERERKEADNTYWRNEAEQAKARANPFYQPKLEKTPLQKDIEKLEAEKNGAAAGGNAGKPEPTQKETTEESKDESGAPAKRGPKTDPTAPHNAKIRWRLKS